MAKREVMIDLNSAAFRKLTLLEGDGYEFGGLFIRRGGRVGIVTSEGRVEWFVRNDWGGIDAKARAVLSEAWSNGAS
jgi:hypothetical protein